MNNRGSEWRKWDLHIHTPETKKNDQFDGSTIDEKWDKYIHSINSSSEDISVIGITDYFCIENYFKFKELIKEGKITKNFDLVIPNIEIRVTPVTGSSTPINLHCIFNPEIENEIESRFLSKLKFSYSGSDFSAKKQELIRLGKSLPGKSNINDNEAHKEGISQYVVSVDIVRDLFKNDTKLRENTIIVVSNKSTDGASGTRNHEDFFISSSQSQLDATRWAIYQFSDAIFSSSPKDFLYFTAQGPDNIKTLIEKCGKLMPCYHGCDAHENSKIFNPDENRFCWIKANPTFQGLKQTLYEPVERVRIQKEEPESEKLDNLMIDEISFESSNNKFTPKPIKLNKNLNVIIGGKSSGKSILLYKIARTLYANTSDDVLKYKDIEDGKHKDLYDLSNDDSNFNFNIKLYSGSSQSLKERQTSASVLPSIKYIPQNHLSNLVDKSRKNGSTLKELIRNLILEDTQYKKKYDDFIDEVRKNDAQRDRDIDYYFSLKDDIKKKENELSNRGDTKSLKEGIDANKKKIDSLSKLFSEEDLKKYNDLVEQKNQSSIEENTVNLDYEKIKNYNIDLKRVLTEQLSKKRIIIDSIVTASIKQQYELKYKFIEKAVEDIESIEKELLRNEQGEFLVDSEFKKLIHDIKIKNEKLDSNLKPFIEKQENSKQIEAIQKSISDDETKLSEIKQFQSEVDTKKKSLLEQKQKIFIDFENNFKEYSKILKELNPRISSIKGQDDKVEIIGSIKYNYPRFKKTIDSISDGRSFNKSGFEYLYDNEKTSLSEFDFEQIKQALKRLFDKIEGNKYILLSHTKPKEACKKVLDDFFYDHWDVKSDNDDIHKMSTGKASFILLKLMIKLSRDKGPILIDQPEDNLDNRSVSKELVEYLKEKKKDRQIILVTHNPNIVVNADAENVIVANQEGQNEIESESPYTFDYINGSLENTFSIIKTEKDLLKSMGIREHIADIVEGGKEAFKKREEKYGF